MRVHIDGRGCKILLAEHQGGPVVSQAGRVDISLEKEACFSIK